MSKTEMSAVLTEICKIDPTFDKEEFLKFCKADIIPNVLEVHPFIPSLDPICVPPSARCDTDT